MNDPITLGIAALILLVVLIAIRMPIAYAMILVGAGGIMWLNGPALLLEPAEDFGLRAVLGLA